MVSRLLLRLFVGRERFLAAIGARRSRFRIFRPLLQARLLARLFVGGKRFLAAIGLGVCGIGFSGRSFRLGRFSLGCFSLILPSLGQKTLTKNAHGASWRIEFDYAGRFANLGFWAGTRGRLTPIGTRLLGRRAIRPVVIAVLQPPRPIGHFRGEIG